MRWWIQVGAATLCAAVISCSGTDGTGKVSDMKVTHLRCEYRVDPLGIDVVEPRLSWELESGVRGQAQTAYRVIVASSGDLLDACTGDLWDSGRVEGGRTVNVVYNGAPLTSRTRCYWKVQAWDRDGVMAESTSAFWSMGLLDDSDWSASWVAMELKDDPEKAGELAPGPPAPYLRTTAVIGDGVRRATAYVTARGLFELFINGGRVGDDVFAPEWTDYDQRINYRTYDVTGLVTSGENGIGAILGDGWYSGYIGWRKFRGHYGFQNSLLFQLEVEYGDGSTDVIVSDGSWRCATGPILSDDFMMGEEYDARMEMPGWDTAGFDDNGWEPVEVVEKPSVPLIWQASQPVRLTREIQPVGVTEPEPGVYVFDLQQNIAGWARLKVEGEAGTKVTLRFAERLNPDGTIYTTNLRAAKATDTYILKGGGPEEWEPRFTFHGFQYIEVTGYPGEPGLDAVTGCVVHSDTPVTGTFECSNPMVNKLWLNTTWGQRGNFISVPTDCPQRDERLGWMGDAQIFARTASYNMDVAAFFTKWMVDVEDAQRADGAYADTSPTISDNVNFFAAPAWGDCGVIIPWTVHLVYGDTRIIERHYDSMTAWMDYLMEQDPDLIRDTGVNNNYGDWLSIEADTPKDVLATAYWAYCATLMSRMADIIGRPDDAVKYSGLFDDIKAVFNETWVSPDGHIHGETQTVYVLALGFDLLPEYLRAKAAEHLVANIRERDWHLSTGFVGGGDLCPVLTEAGYEDVAYRLLLNDTFPSWGYSIRHGATTIWERWDGWTEDKGFQNPGMNSFNHYAYGSITEWLFRYAAGIDTETDPAGFGVIVIRPHVGGDMTHLGATYRSIHGLVASRWERDGDRLGLTVTVPANTTATVHVPADDGAAVTEGGVPAGDADGVTPAGYEDGHAVFEVGSGTYAFETAYTK